jgi:hypothetical protein
LGPEFGVFRNSGERLLRRPLAVYQHHRRVAGNLERLKSLGVFGVVEIEAALLVPQPLSSIDS